MRSWFSCSPSTAIVYITRELVLRIKVRLELDDTYLLFVRAVVYGREICPELVRIHIRCSWSVERCHSTGVLSLKERSSISFYP